MVINWNAKWIWDNGEAQPRNYWVCFRKIFEMSECVDGAYFHITADSRYILYINNCLIGMGPVRSWPFEQFYDTYEVKKHLKKGQNVIAILVTHYGTSNFQYIEGRGGLFAQLDVLQNGTKKTIGTDKSWKNHIHTGYGRNSVRISCQQGWAEMYDASAFDEMWRDISYNDKNWVSSAEIGRYGMEPWKCLQQRDIPFLREDIVYPARVESVKEVSIKGLNISLDLQQNFFPEEVDSITKMFTGYIASIIKSPKKMKAKITFPWSKMSSLYGNFRMNERLYNTEGDTREIDIELDEGQNLFIMDVSGKTVGYFSYFNIDAEEAVEFSAPGYDEYEFISIGPFNSKPFLNIGELINNEFNWDEQLYKSVLKVGNENRLKKFNKWIKPIDAMHTNKSNVYMSSVYKNIIRTFDLFYEMQNMIVPNEEYSIIYPGEKGDIEVMLDFGKEISGYIEFDLEASAGTVADFYGLEYLSMDGTVEYTEGLNCTLRYITHVGRQRYRSVIRRGFRYLMVSFRGVKEPIKVYRIFAHLCTYPVADIGRFECSDWQLNRIWEISKSTTQLCMEDTFVDCPAYEQVFWVGDSRNEALINYYCFGAYEIVKRCLRLVAKSVERSPLPECQVPSGHQAVITAWALFWITACKEYFDYTADLDFLEEVFPYIEKAASGFVKRINEDGLLELQAFNMLDWAPMDTPDRGVITHQNAGLVKVFKDFSAIARWLGKESVAQEFEDLALGLKTAINKYLWDEEKQAYFDCIHESGKRSQVISMQTNVMVYLCDCAVGNRKDKIEKYLLDKPEGFVGIGSPFMSFFYFEALIKIQSIEEMLKHIREEWGGMIKQGATTCWETFPGYEKERLTRSHCHAWSAAPGYFLSAHILGVRPIEPGFKKVMISPGICDLKWARGSVPVPGGRIDIAWEKTDKGAKVWVKGPKKIEYIFDHGLEVEMF